MKYLKVKQLIEIQELVSNVLTALAYNNFIKRIKKNKNTEINIKIG